MGSSASKENVAGAGREYDAMDSSMGDIAGVSQEQQRMNRQYADAGRTSASNSSRDTNAPKDRTGGPNAYSVQSQQQYPHLVVRGRNNSNAPQYNPYNQHPQVQRGFRRTDSRTTASVEGAGFYPDAATAARVNAEFPPQHYQQSIAKTGRQSMNDEMDTEQMKEESFHSSDMGSAEVMGKSTNTADPGIELQRKLAELEPPTQTEIVPMVFKWEHGGREVGITGTFNNWGKQIPMHRSGNDFTYIANLPRGHHAYKFVVDDEWRFAPDQPTVADVEGHINNFVDVSDFTPLSDFDESATQDEEDDDDGMYGRFMPDIDEYTKEPPPLPPHLRHIILNKIPPSVDYRLLPVPQHVALNHLYCTAIKDGMMVLGLTQRYKQKFVTTVYYSLMPGGAPPQQ